MRHGAPSDVDVETWLGDDPALALVNADMTAWLASRPECLCDGLCICDAESPA